MLAYGAARLPSGHDPVEQPGHVRVRARSDTKGLRAGFRPRAGARPSSTHTKSTGFVWVLSTPQEARILRNLLVQIS